MANLLKGKPVSDKIIEDCQNKVNILKSKGITPTLAIFRVGNNDSDLSYEKGIINRCKQIDVNVKQFIFDLDVYPITFYRG